MSAVADGADQTQGAKADTAVGDPTASASVVALLKGLLQAGGPVRAAIRATLNAVQPAVRPSDTNAYAAKDVVADATSGAHVWTFTGMAAAIGGGGTVRKAVLQTDQTTCVARLRLHLFNAAPTALQDNAACTAPLFASHSAYVGKIDFPALATEGSGGTAASAINDYDQLDFLTAADANLYGILETLDAFTPASGQKFEITLER